MSKQNKIFMDCEQIKQYIPHRYPFILIDRIVSFENNQLIALKNVTNNESVFQGHFPEQAILPGVLIIEAMAQASGILAYLVAGVPPDHEKELYFFAGIDGARFKRPVVPGDQLLLEIKLITEKNHYQVIKTACTATVDDNIVCTAELLIAKKSRDK